MVRLGLRGAGRGGGMGVGFSLTPGFWDFSQWCLVCGCVLVGLVSGTEVRRLLRPQKMVAGPAGALAASS